MAEQMTLIYDENGISSRTQNDVVSMQHTIMETTENSVCDGNESLVFVCSEITTTTTPGANNIDDCGSGSGGDGSAMLRITALSLNRTDSMSSSNNNNNNPENANQLMAKNKGKRRRRKSKPKAKTNNTKPYKKSNWKYQIAPRAPARRADDSIAAGLSTLVPYNTNKFLMEEHMPQIPSGAGCGGGGARTRDSSFSVDDSEDNNYFHSLPEDEEAFLTKEFSSVYEDARSERLDGMSKSQLIREYLQMEANYDKLSRNLGARKYDDDNAKEQQQARNFEREGIISKLEERVKELTAENLDLRRQMADIRSRGRRSKSRSDRAAVRSTRRNNATTTTNQTNCNNTSSSSSEDSESDSTDTGTSSDNHTDDIHQNSNSHSSMSDTDIAAVSPLAPTVNCNHNSVQNHVDTNHQ